MSTPDYETAYYALLREQRDAALEVLRPFARMGYVILKAEAAPPMNMPLLPEQLWMISAGNGVVANLKRSDCLAALEFWQSHRSGVEP